MAEHAGRQRKLADADVFWCQGWIVSERLLQEGGGGLAFAEGVVRDDAAQEITVGGHTEYSGVFQRPEQPTTGFVAIGPPGDHLGQHGIIVRRNRVPGAHAGITPQPFSFRRLELVQRPGLRCEAVGWVFCVKAHFNGMAVQLDLVLC